MSQSRGPLFEPKDPDYELRVRESFARQAFMRLLGAELRAVYPGQVEIVLPFGEQLTQQHGFVHAAAITGIADVACGYAALSLMEPDLDVLSVEFKVNFLAPAAGERFIAVGKVIRPGRTLTVCTGEVHAEQDGKLKAIAHMQATMIAPSSLRPSAC